MITVLQRVSKAAVEINQQIRGEIKQGLVILIGIEANDTDEDVDWITRKISNLRIFNDEAFVMNKSILDINGEILLISQFTLHASTKKGNRPSYIKAAHPEIAFPIYNTVINHLTKKLGKPIVTGEFGADMQISLINDGPITIVLDSKNKV